MSTVLPQYPFDPTGQAASNLIVETQSIRSRGMFDHYYIIPRSGPFYGDSVRLRLYPQGANVNNPAGGTALEEGVHYNFGYHFAHASHTIGLPVYGAISFYDRQLEGQLRMEYQTIGDDWVLDDQAYSELLLNVAFNPRITTWEQVVELPRMFPVVNHDFNIDDFVGMSEVEDKLGDIELAILQRNAGGLADHLADYTNPHEVTKDQVGLGLVDNFPTATVGEATTGTANNRFMTPLRTKQLIDAVATAAINLHLADYNNPHQVTKAQVGLGNVGNYSLASQAEAEAGSSNTRYMTPLRVREAIDVIVGAALNAHVADKANPHQVTKAQVGLGNVPNIGVATDTSALVGTTDDGIITPRLLALVLSETVGSGMSDHTSNFSNPHGVTKAQVGLGSVQNFPPATEAEARDATSAERYMTPLAVRQAINELVGDSSNAHVIDYTNPHNVTKAQVGLGNVGNYPDATETEAREGTAADRYMTPLSVRYAIESLSSVALNSHTSDFNNPHSVTAAQVGTYSEIEIDTLIAGRLSVTGIAADAARLFGLDQEGLEGWIATLYSGNTYLFEGKTYTEAKADILSGVAADSAKLDGKTYQEIVQQISAAVDGSSTQYVITTIGGVENALGDIVEPPVHWLKIGKYVRPADFKFADMTLLITGGRGDADVENHHTIMLELSCNVGELETEPNSLSVKYSRITHLSWGLVPIELGYVVDNVSAVPAIDIYIKTDGYRAGWMVTELSNRCFVPENTPVPQLLADLVTAEPAGIVYPTVVDDGSLELQALREFVDRRDNPMQVTKAQVGLGNVQNYATASDAQAVAGTATNLFMTPATTQAKMDNDLGVLCDELIVVIDDALTNLFA